MSDNKDKPFATPGDMAGIRTGTNEPFSTTQIKLPNGTVLDLSDWSNESLRSALFVDPWRTDKSWELFIYGRGMPIPGTEIVASRAHTNIPRSGDTGLPRDWEMYVTQWRALANMPLEQPVLDWAAETSVQFSYNDKFYGNATLLDLLLSPRPIGDPLPVRMRENLGYSVQINSDERAIEALRSWLRGGGAMADNVRDAVTELDAIVRLQADETVRKALQHVQAKLRPGRTLTTWVHLEGPIKRVIV